MQDFLEPDQKPQNTEFYTVPRYLSVLGRFTHPKANSASADNIDEYAAVYTEPTLSPEIELQPEIDSLVSARILDEETDERINSEKYLWNMPELSDELEKVRDFTAQNFSCRLRKLREDWDEDLMEELEQMDLELLFYIS